MSNVEFEEQEFSAPRVASYEQPKKRPLMHFFVSKGIFKNEDQATKYLLILSIIAIVVALALPFIRTGSPDISVEDVSRSLQAR